MQRVLAQVVRLSALPFFLTLFSLCQSAQAVTPPIIIKAFGAASVPVGGTTSLTFTIQNNDPSGQTGIAFSDNLPSGLLVATPNGLAGACGGGTITAPAGSAAVTLSGATLAASTSCSFSVNVTGTTAGSKVNTTSNVTSNEGGTGGTATAFLNVDAPPTLSTGFNPAQISPGGTTSLTFTTTNPAGNPDTFTGVSFTDTLPSGLTVPNASATVCGGTVTLTAPSSITMTGATITSGNQCQFSVTVTGALSGAYINTTSSVTSTEGGTGNNSSANLLVAAPPVIIKAFGAASMPLGGSTSLTFIIQNGNNNGFTLHGIGFTDSLPSGLVVSTPNGLAGSCGGGTITAPAGSGSVSLSGATIAASSSCTFSINVTGTSAGVKNNTTSNVTSTEAGIGGTASASVNIDAPPVLTIGFNPAQISPGGTTSLTFTTTNPATNPDALTGISFSDILPAGLTVPNASATVCGGTVTLTAPSLITMTGATIAVGNQCQFSVTVTGALSAQYANLAGPVSSTNGGTGNSSIANLLVAAPPTITKAFGAAGIPLGGTTSLTFNISNSNNNSFTLNGIGFTDSLPAGLVVSTPNGLTGSCGGGTVTAVAGAGSLSLSGASLPAGASCSFSVNVTGTSAGVKNNTTSVVTSTEAGNGGTASASIHVDAPPTLAISFNPSPIALNATTSLTFTAANPAANPDTLTGISFFDTLPTGLTVPNASATVCGGTVTLTAPTGISMVGASLPPGGTCQFSVTVTGAAGGQYTNTAGPISSTNGGTGNTASASLTVNIPTSTALAPSLPAPTYGQAETFTATVTSTSGTPTGTVTFTDTTTSTVLASNVALNGSGQAIFSTTTLAAGSHTIQAAYTPTGNFAASTASISITVNKAVLTVTANNATKPLGAPLPAFTATLTGFVNGDTQASATTGSPSLTTAATATSATGTYPITAAVGTLAATNYTFTFVNGTLTVGKGATTTTLVLSGGALLATVAPVAPATGVPTGTVQFLNGTTVLGTVTLSSAGTATISAPPGTFTAVYSGDTSFNGSSSNSVTISAPATSSLSLTSSLNPSALGQAVTFTATVSTNGGPSTAPAPTGTVQFLDGAKPLGTTGVSGGQATFTTSTLTGGSHNIVAQYSGDGTWPAASATLGQTVNASVTMTLTASPASPVFGQSVTLTANVGATVPTGFAAPTGQVTFSLQGANPVAAPTPLGTATLSSGSASISVSTLPVGAQIISAQYGGDGAWPSASRQIAVTVLPASTVTAVSLSIVSGQLTLTAVVAAAPPASGTPTGSLQFIDSSSSTLVGSAALSGGKGSATISASAASTVIGRPIVAVYSGDGNFTTSTSAPLLTAINAAGNSSANFASDEIVSLFGIAGLNGDTPATLPLTTTLGSVTVNIVDTAGTAHPALLYGVFASAGQINLVIPAGTAAGLAVVTVTLPGGNTISTVIQIAGSAPGVFTANMTGKGPYAGQVLYLHADGSQTVANAANFNSGSNTFVPNPINLAGATDQVFLVLYGTGIRHAVSVTATVNGVNVPVVYSGAQGSFPGMDQLNLGPLPASLAGAGIVNLVITVDGQSANMVTIQIQ